MVASVLPPAIVVGCIKHPVVSAMVVSQWCGGSSEVELVGSENLAGKDRALGTEEVSVVAS